MSPPAPENTQRIRVLPRNGILLDELFAAVQAGCSTSDCSSPVTVVAEYFEDPGLLYACCSQHEGWAEAVQERTDRLHALVSQRLSS